MEIIIGRMRTWKTGAAVANAKPGKTLFISPQRDLGRLVIRENYFRRDKIIVIDLDRFDRTLKTLHIPASRAKDEIQRNDEDREARHTFVDVSGSGRNSNEFVNFLIYQHALSVAGLFQHQRNEIPVWWASKIFNFMSCELGDAIRGCTSWEYKKKAKAWCFVNQFQFSKDIGPTQRFVDSLGDGCVIAHCGNFDPQKSFKDNEIIIVMGGMSAGATILRNHWLQESITFAQNGNSINVVADEADKDGVPGRGMFSARTINAILMNQKFGWNPSFIIQTLHNLDPEVQGTLLDAAERINCHAIGDPRSMELMAKIMGKVDPYAVHHVDRRKREFSDGYDQVIMRERIHKDSNELRERVTHLARRREATEETTHYLGLTDQRILREQDIAGLEKGERFVRSGSVSWKEKVRFLHDPFLWKEVSDKRVDKFLLEILDRPEFTKTEIQKPKGGPWVVVSWLAVQVESGGLIL